jgi:hypothetical protein
MEKKAKFNKKRAKSAKTGQKREKGLKWTSRLTSENK